MVINDNMLSISTNAPKNTSDTLLESIIKAMEEYYAAEHSRKVKRGIAMKKHSNKSAK